MRRYFLKTRLVTVLSFISIVCFFVITGCDYNAISVPEFPDSLSAVFNPGEVKYIPINPAWKGSPWNFHHPIDIYISIDGYIFIADSGNARVLVLDKTGNIISQDDNGNDFTALTNISDADDASGNISPVGIAVDSKLNIYIVDISDNIYLWNQYINNVGVDSVASAIIYVNLANSNIKTITNFSESYTLEDSGYTIDHAVFQYNPDKVDSILAPHVFYDDLSKGSAQFISVAAAPFGVEQIYVADNGERQRIAIIKMERSEYLKLKDGTKIWQHKGTFLGNAATDGTGAGTVNNPRGICVDEEGNIYYTQLGVNFGFHKIKELPGFNNWTSAFMLGEHEIMNLEQFIEPFDVSVDDDGNIFVLNSGLDEVLEFDNFGKFVRKAGIREVQIDTTVIDTIITKIDTLGLSFIDTSYVERDTIVTRFYNDLLNHPEGIFVDDEVIYVVDSGNNQILRFKLSSEVDIEIPE